MAAKLIGADRGRAHRPGQPRRAGRGAGRGDRRSSSTSCWPARRVAVGLAKRVLDAAAKPALARDARARGRRPGAVRAHGGLRRGHARVRREAPAGVQRPLSDARGYRLAPHGLRPPVPGGRPRRRHRRREARPRDARRRRRRPRRHRQHRRRRRDLRRPRLAPTPTSCTFWLADRIDERGWGLGGDTFAVMDGLRELGVDVWFNLGDRDLAIGLRRARRLAEGARLTEALAELRRRARRARARAADGRRARAHVRADAATAGGLPGVHDPRARGAGPIEDVALRGIDAARRRRPRCSAAIADARGDRRSARRTP